MAPSVTLKLSFLLRFPSPIICSDSCFYVSLINAAHSEINRTINMTCRVPDHTVDLCVDCEERFIHSYINRAPLRSSVKRLQTYNTDNQNCLHRIIYLFPPFFVVCNHPSIALVLYSVDAFIIASCHLVPLRLQDCLL